jgi:hypothetical protein
VGREDCPNSEPQTQREPRPQSPRGGPAQRADAASTHQERNKQSRTDRSMVHESVTLPYYAHEPRQMQIGTRAGSFAYEQRLGRDGREEAT